MLQIGRILVINNKGSSAILVAISMVTLIGFASLVVDMGNLFLAKTKLNNALDAAVLAGSLELPNSESDAIQKAKDYFVDNGFDQSLLTNVTVSADKKTITASGQTKVEYFLATVLGINSSTVYCTSAARISPVTKVRGVVPVGIRNPHEDEGEPPLQTGQDYKLKISAGDDANEYLGSGNFGLLDFTGTEKDEPGEGSKEWLKDFKSGHQGELKIGMPISTVTGNKVGKAVEGLRYRLDKCTHTPECTPSNFDPSCPRIIVIPVYEVVVTGQNQIKELTIEKFAVFLLTDYVKENVGQGNSSYIVGQFIEMTVEGEGDENATEEECGAYSTRLIKPPV